MIDESYKDMFETHRYSGYAREAQQNKHPFTVNGLLTKNEARHLETLYWEGLFYKEAAKRHDLHQEIEMITTEIHNKALRRKQKAKAVEFIIFVSIILTLLVTCTDLVIGAIISLLCLIPFIGEALKNGGNVK